MCMFPENWSTTEDVGDCFASSRTATIISVLTAMYTKRFNTRKDSMGKFIDVFETLFA